MALIPMNQTGDISLSSSRLCWVLNRDIHPYAARFRGEIVTIPANNEKIAKLSQHGGNLMPYLEACRFVRDLVEPQGYEMSPTGQAEPIFRKKMLYEKELTAAEFAEIHGKKVDSKKEAAREEKEARLKHASNVAKVPGKVAAKDEDE